MINPINNVLTKGLEACTIFNDKPYFLLMCDIDTKDPENLLSILKYFEKWNYSVYYYETSKGYHIISPVLLTLRTWAFRIESLRNKIKNYRFVALRISRRKEESAICYFKSWNYNKYKESKSLSILLNTLFAVIKDEHLVKPKDTKLFFIEYEQLNYSIDGSNKSSTIGFSSSNGGYLSSRNTVSDVNHGVIESLTLDYSTIYEKEEM